jgi:hypothetical protein
MTSMSFTVPTDLTPFLPPANTVTIAPIATQDPLTDQYQVTPTDSPPSAPFVDAVPKGTPLSKVAELAAGNVAWRKFQLATLTAADRVNPSQMQTALAWFLNKIGRPDYGL